jgi:hypothetical protein
MKLVMPKFMFGIYTRDGRFIERVADAPNEDAAWKLALKGFTDEEIRLCIADTEPEGDPKKTEALIEALLELARHRSRPRAAAVLPYSARHGCTPTPPLHIITASVCLQPHLAQLGAVPRSRLLVARESARPSTTPRGFRGPRTPGEILA